jgi:hypothetical protein
MSEIVLFSTTCRCELICCLPDIKRMLVFYINWRLLYVVVCLGVRLGSGWWKKCHLDEFNLRCWLLWNRNKLVWNTVLSMLIPLCRTYNHIVLSMSVCDRSVINVQMQYFLFLQYFFVPKIFITGVQTTKQPKSLSLLRSKSTTWKLSSDRNEYTTVTSK